MKCDRCKVDMVIGKAIDYDDRPFGITAQARLNNETLELIDVLKCPKCGHSSRIKESF